VLQVLRSFRLGNHRSFGDEQELLLMPSLPGDERAALPVTAVYGANASGKSSLLDGLRFMRQSVIGSFRQWDIEGGVPRHAFRLAPELRSQPSVFVVELTTNGVRYTYGFTVDSERVCEEWLYSYPEKRKRILFERDGDQLSFGSTVPDLRVKLDVLQELTRPNALFLSVAAQSRLETLMPVYRWFQIALLFRGRSYDRSDSADAIKRLFEKDASSRSRFLGLLAAADVGIADVRLEEAEDPFFKGHAEELEEKNRELAAKIDNSIDVDEKEVLVDQWRRVQAQLSDARYRQLRPLLKLVHRNSEELFDIQDESAGTRAWIELLPIVLSTLDTGRVLLVDEIDSSLHPLLTARLVGLFQDDDTNPHGAQLIFTTHDTSLLGTMLGKEVLCRDQVWFVEKGENGASKLYPLTDFKPRHEQNFERRYLGGSYGAVPVFDPQDFADAVLGR
jgi:uncharacterized protein